MQRAFRIRAKHFFLTYPKCPVPPQEALAQLRLKVAISQYLICVEDHADGTPHLHVYLCTDAVREVTDQAFFDLEGAALQRDPGGVSAEGTGMSGSAAGANSSGAAGAGGSSIRYHGNYQAARSAANVVKYVKKNGNYITNIKNGVLPKEGRRELAKKLIDSGFESFIIENPQFIFGYKKLKLDYIEYINDQYTPTIRDVTAHWYYGETRLGKSWKALIDQAGLFLEYDIDTRKPRLAGNMSNIYFKNSQNKWFDGYTGQSIIFIDELPREAAPWILNYVKQWTDRIPLQPEIKGSRLWARWNKVIITCQHGPRDFFAGHHTADIEAILARFTVHHITVKQF